MAKRAFHYEVAEDLASHFKGLRESFEEDRGVPFGMQEAPKGRAKQFFLSQGPEGKRAYITDLAEKKYGGDLGKAAEEVLGLVREK